MASVSLGSGMILNPTSVALATQDNYVSALTTQALAMHKRDIDENFVKRYGNQGITGLLELVGAKKEATQTKFEHYEEAFIHNVVKLTTPGSFSANTAAHMDYTEQDNTDALNGDKSIDGTNNDTPVRVGDILLAPNGELGYVTAVAATDSDVDVQAFDGTWNLAVSTEYEFAIIGNMWAENTDQPSSLMPRIHTYTNECMIIKESFEVSGTEATNVIYFKVDNEKMGSGYLWYLKGEADTYKRFLDYCELQMILGKKITNSTLTGSSATIDGVASTSLSTLRSTEGLFDFVSNKGWDTEYFDWPRKVRNVDELGVVVLELSRETEVRKA